MKLNPITYTENMLIVDPEIFNAPNTRMTLKKIPKKLNQRVLQYLVKYCNKKEYTSTLLLLALILESRNCTSSYIYNIICLLAKRLNKLFHNNSYNEYRYNITPILDSYLFKDKTDSDRTKYDFFKRYNTALGYFSTWFQTLKEKDKETFLPFILPYYEHELFKNKLKQIHTNRTEKRKRKSVVDLIMENFPKFRNESKSRSLLIEKIYLYFVNSNHCGIFTIIHGNLKLDFEIIEIKDLLSNYHVEDIPENINPNEKLIKFISINGNSDPNSLSTFWLYDMCKYGLFHHSPLNEECEQWLTSWKYSAYWLNSVPTNFLTWKEPKFFYLLCRLTNSVFLPIESLFLPSKFAALAIELITTNGMRINEVMQVNISKDCLVQLIIPIYKENNIIDRKIRYSLRTLPKGENNKILHDNFVSNEAIEMIYNLTQLLQEYYSLSENQTLPIISYSKYHGSFEKFEDAPYLFQLNKVALSSQAIANSIKFILHGLNYNSNENTAVAITPHLLRHCFATHAVNVAKIDVDIIGKILHQKTLSVTQYYSEPTRAMIAESNEVYLAFLDNSLDVDEVLKRSPPELVQQFKDYQSSCGTLANVIGGHCTSHGICKAQFSCIGCAAKVPDPAQKNQLVNQKAWAENQISYFQAEGLYPEVQKLTKVVNAVDRELDEIKNIEEYAKEKKLISVYQIDGDK